MCSCSARTPRAGAATRIGRIDRAPWFVLGPPRAGATIVARALAHSGRFVYLTAADIAAFHGLSDEAAAVLGRLESAGATRTIDEIQISPDVPEEYGFLLPERHLTDAFAPRLAEVYQSLAEKRGPAARWLLRNPYDLAHVPRIERHFADARYVFVVRDPIWTIDSQLRALRKLFAERSAYHALLDLRYRRWTGRGWRFALARFAVSRARLVDRMLRAFGRSTGRWLGDLDALPRDRWLVTRHEDMIERPLAELERLYAFLDLPPDGLPELAAQVHARHRPLDPHVESRADRIRERTREYREAFDY